MKERADLGNNVYDNPPNGRVWLLVIHVGHKDDGAYHINGKCQPASRPGPEKATDIDLAEMTEYKIHNQTKRGLGYIGGSRISGKPKDITEVHQGRLSQKNGTKNDSFS
jgi:hypothetical protein